MGVQESLRERLVSTGVDLLEQVGAGQLGLRAIAREAGVSHGAPRRHFPTHRALLAAVAARGFADLRRELGARTDRDPRARVEAIALEYVRFARERPEMFTLMFRHDLLEGSGENLRGRTLPIYREWTELIGACVRARPDEPALQLWANLHGIATLVANRSLELISPEADVAELVRAAVARHLDAERG
ncbi:TetR/AcrR family transcriptional regulator [Nocardia sp. CDC159]|uniref:TetR/AcrR family transcriptional regulator n=1 Tax=Nocardia pulmonis TaxID=2951408 RepID=A0A9X2EA89_9NOCA|nr:MULTISPECIES: TetR/AcrR family transcriptional regulator [Nocardia]MCM6777194.1 TetR/AcrR family transcriptional regulator [Nocardia pulmonis]MCM6790079.1 TetR/AcrR family transcriptional regulator [Nocardia sp. CDC159]